jgi:hypothetical protein
VRSAEAGLRLRRGRFWTRETERAGRVWGVSLDHVGADFNLLPPSNLDRHLIAHHLPNHAVFALVHAFDYAHCAADAQSTRDRSVAIPHAAAAAATSITATTK